MTIITSPKNVIAIETAMDFDRTLESLRAELTRCEFRILSEVDFSRELDSHIGLSASNYAILIVWHAFSAYQALLSDLNGGLMVPFNVAVYQKDGVTTVSVLLQPSLTPEASLGIRALGHDLNRRVRDVFLRLGTHEQQGSPGRASHASSARR